ncbi:hypothetical protein BCY86_08230 [Pajaroellobacter abortibovis]|uniref:Uncharacterized protein n=1 Tax=Pajaroellobacter abortibovis TaxID=1882918 RepID=A0A1L6MYK0_9BACT|nr:hypothetical protein BCY86_08230 [Pajaroellobacter abortibovis]
MPFSHRVGFLVWISVCASVGASLPAAVRWARSASEPPSLGVVLLALTAVKWIPMVLMIAFFRQVRMGLRGFLMQQNAVKGVSFLFFCELVLLSHSVLGMWLRVDTHHAGLAALAFVGVGGFLMTLSAGFSMRLMGTLSRLSSPLWQALLSMCCLAGPFLLSFYISPYRWLLSGGKAVEFASILVWKEVLIDGSMYVGLAWLFSRSLLLLPRFSSLVAIVVATCIPLMGFWMIHTVPAVQDHVLEHAHEARWIRNSVFFPLLCTRRAKVNSSWVRGQSEHPAMGF